MTEHTAMSTPADDPWLMLTPAGVLHAYAERVPDERAAMLQALMPRGASLRRSAWLAQASEHRTLLARALHEGWVHEVERELRAPDVRLDNLSRPLRPGHLMEDMERALIEQTLVKFNGHREKTAKSLGIGVRTLGMKLKRWREEAAAAAQNQRLAG